MGARANPLFLNQRADCWGKADLCGPSFFSRAQDSGLPWTWLTHPGVGPNMNQKGFRGEIKATSALSRKRIVGPFSSRGTLRRCSRDGKKANRWGLGGSLGTGLRTLSATQRKEPSSPSPFRVISPSRDFLSVFPYPTLVIFLFSGERDTLRNNPGFSGVAI